jgi:hypothetical protein
MRAPSVWVGLTKCDADRKRRTKKAEQIWVEVASSPNLGSAHSILGGAIDLFREGLSCFQNGAFMASNLICRSVTETAIYLAISRKSPCPPPSTIDIDFKHIGADWGKIRHKAKDMKVLTEYDLRDLVEIRKRGNFVAHYGQIFDQRILTPVDPRIGELRLWGNEEEAEDSLRKAAAILNKVIEKIF